MKFVDRMEMWESVYGHRRREYVLEAVEWIYNKYEDLLTNRWGDKEACISHLFDIVVTIKQTDVNNGTFMKHHRPEVVYLKSSINKLKRSFYAPNTMVAVVVPRSVWSTYNRRKNKRYASNIKFEDYRGAVMSPTIHELTHFIQHIRNHAYGEVETTENEIEFIRNEYPNMYSKMDSNYYDNVSIRKGTFYWEVKYKTYEVAVTINDKMIDFNKLSTIKATDIKPDSTSWKRNYGSHVYNDFLITKEKNNQYFLYYRGDFIKSFKKKGEANLYLVLIETINK